jgi:6-phosphogluconolactonase (cycloisomerase 2 family)
MGKESSQKGDSMNRSIRLVAGACALVGLSALVAPIAADAGTYSQGHFGDGGRQAVFVQTDNPAGNQVVAYARGDNGALTLAGTYGTGGLGGVLNGSHVDHLGSQGSLTFDPIHQALYAVNAGSNSISVFSVQGDQLSLRQTINSGGTFPVSVAVHGDFVSVLNAENGGAIQEYVTFFGRLYPIGGANRTLGLTIPTDATQFTHTPGQVAYSPDGSQLIVTTKASSNAIEVFNVGIFGSLSPSPVINTVAGTVPFAITFDQVGHLVIAEAGPSALETFALNRNGTVSPIDSLASGQTGLCWVTADGNQFFTGNTAANSTSGYESSVNGQLTLLGSTPTDPGTVDGTGTPDGHNLYVQTGGLGIVDEFHVGFNGSLSEIGSVTVANSAGGEGIAAT